MVSWGGPTHIFPFRATCLLVGTGTKATCTRDLVLPFATMERQNKPQKAKHEIRGAKRFGEFTKCLDRSETLYAVFWLLSIPPRGHRSSGNRALYKYNMDRQQASPHLPRYGGKERHRHPWLGGSNGSMSSSWPTARVSILEGKHAHCWEAASGWLPLRQRVPGGVEAGDLKWARSFPHACLPPSPPFPGRRVVPLCEGGR